MGARRCTGTDPLACAEAARGERTGSRRSGQINWREKERERDSMPVERRRGTEGQRERDRGTEREREGERGGHHCRIKSERERDGERDGEREGERRRQRERARRETRRERTKERERMRDREAAVTCL